MPIMFDNQRAVFDGQCTIEETDALLVWIQEHPKREIDLTGCEHLHTALLQALLSHPADRVKAPEDPFLKSWIHPLLASRSLSPST